MQGTDWRTSEYRNPQREGYIDAEDLGRIELWRNGQLGGLALIILCNHLREQSGYSELIGDVFDKVPGTWSTAD